MASELEFIAVAPELIDAELKKLSGWSYNGQSIERTFTHDSFLEAIAFVNRVAVVAERFNHHPDFDISFKRVILRLWTHKMNAVTRADLTVAAEIDKVVV